MNIRIGLIQSTKELEVELPDDADGEKIVEEISGAAANESGIVWLTDRKGRRVGVAASKVAYVEISPETEDRRVGFSAL